MYLRTCRWTWEENWKNILSVSVSAEGGLSSTATAASSSAIFACDQSGVVAVTPQHQLPSGPAVSAERGLSSSATASSSAGYTSFSSLVEVPHRERGQGQKRARLPTLLLSSPEHMDFLSQNQNQLREEKLLSKGTWHRWRVLDVESLKALLLTGSWVVTG